MPIRQERLKGDELIRFLHTQFTLLVKYEGEQEAQRVWLAAMSAVPPSREALKSAAADHG